MTSARAEAIARATALRDRAEQGEFGPLEDDDYGVSFGASVINLCRAIVREVDESPPQDSLYALEKIQCVLTRWAEAARG